MAQRLLVSFSVVLFATATVLFAGHAQASDICAKADFAPLCRSVVKGATDSVVATKTAIEHLIFETKRAKDASAKFGKSQTLDVCKENLIDAISNLEKCLENIKSNDKPSLKINLSAAMTDYVTCDDAVAESGTGSISVLSVSASSGILSNDKMLRELASNSLYLASLTT